MKVCLVKHSAYKNRLYESVKTLKAQAALSSLGF